MIIVLSPAWAGTYWAGYLHPGLPEVSASILDRLTSTMVSLITREEEGGGERLTAGGDRGGGQHSATHRGHSPPGGDFQ